MAPPPSVFGLQPYIWYRWSDSNHLTCRGHLSQPCCQQQGIDPLALILPQTCRGCCHHSAQLPCREVRFAVPFETGVLPSSRTVPVVGLEPPYLPRSPIPALLSATRYRSASAYSPANLSRMLPSLGSATLSRSSLRRTIRDGGFALVSNGTGGRTRTDTP